jgi:predicted RNA-binding Zn-ribbon protein involved in translation (DUF1610 family)
MSMEKVFCPTTGQREWANEKKESDRDNMYRCTKCGRDHSK